MVYDDTFSISVNGQHRRVPAGSTVADLALELGLEPTRVAVERNLEIVPRSTLAEVWLDSRATAKTFYAKLGFELRASVPCSIAAAALAARSVGP